MPGVADWLESHGVSPYTVGYVCGCVGFVAVLLVVARVAARRCADCGDDVQDERDEGPRTVGDVFRDNAAAFRRNGGYAVLEQLDDEAEAEDVANVAELVGLRARASLPDDESPVPSSVNP